MFLHFCKIFIETFFNLYHRLKDVGNVQRYVKEWESDERGYPLENFYQRPCIKEQQT